MKTKYAIWCRSELETDLRAAGLEILCQEHEEDGCVYVLAEERWPGSVDVYKLNTDPAVIKYEEAPDD